MNAILTNHRRVIASNLKDKTSLQAAELQEKRNSLGRRIELWRIEQAEHMPNVASEIERHAGSHPEKIAILLPSGLPPTPDLAALRLKETRLRIAQADDALVELRRLLRITAGLSDYKYTQIGFGQGPNTRARSQISRFKDKVSLTAERYRAAHQALLALDPHGLWIMRLRQLADSDICWPRKNPEEGEGTREISWIWRARTTRPTPTAPVTSRPTTQHGSDEGSNDELVASDSEIGEGS